MACPLRSIVQFATLVKNVFVPAASNPLKVVAAATWNFPPEVLQFTPAPTPEAFEPMMQPATTCVTVKPAVTIWSPVQFGFTPPTQFVFDDVEALPLAVMIEAEAIPALSKSAKRKSFFMD